MRPVLKTLASLRLTMAGLAALIINSVAISQWPEASLPWVVLPLSVLAVNLFAALIVRHAFRQQAALLLFHVGLLAVVDAAQAVPDLDQDHLYHGAQVAAQGSQLLAPEHDQRDEQDDQQVAGSEYVHADGASFQGAKYTTPPPMTARPGRGFGAFVLAGALMAVCWNLRAAGYPSAAIRRSVRSDTV